MHDSHRWRKPWPGVFASIPVPHRDWLQRCTCDMTCDDSAQAGEAPVVSAPGGFEHFYATQYSSVLATVSVLVRSRAIAEEITQDAFVEAFARWDRVEAMASPTGWVHRVASNAALSRFRRWRAEARALRRATPATEDDEAGPPEFEAAWDLWRAVRRLPRRQAQVIVLSYVAGMSRSEIALVVGCSPETVKTHLARGRATLASWLRDDRK